MPVSELLDRVPGDEIVEWKAFANYEPFGLPIENRRWGLLLSMFANVHRKPDSAPLNPEDFLPTDYGAVEMKAKTEITPEEKKRAQQGVLDMIKNMFGGGKKE